MLRAWAWAKWRCNGCDSTLGFSMKRRFLIGLIFAPIGGVIGFLSATGLRFNSNSQFLYFGALAAFGIIATILAMKIEGIVVVEPRGIFCEGCGYNLTGNATGTCPECGRATPVASALPMALVPMAKPIEDSHA
jgi:hypothetical protein